MQVGQRELPHDKKFENLVPEAATMFDKNLRDETEAIETDFEFLNDTVPENMFRQAAAFYKEVSHEKY